MTDLDEILDIEPGVPGMAEKYGHEPSLRKLIFNYYADHFEPLEAARMTEEYVLYLGDAVRDIYE